VTTVTASYVCAENGGGHQQMTKTFNIPRATLECAKRVAMDYAQTLPYPWHCVGGSWYDFPSERR